MNILSHKQHQIKIFQYDKRITKIIQHQKHHNYRDNHKTTPWNMLNYISTDFVYNLFYMMIHKRFIHYFVVDYHRIYDLILVLQRINPPLPPRKLKEKINNLFDGIETEEEVFDAFKLFRYNAVIRNDEIILTKDIDFDESYNPAYPEQREKYILPRYMLKNFLMFRQAFIDCVMRKFPNNLDYWIYACGYLLMDNKDFHDFGLNNDVFPYIKR